MPFRYKIDVLKALKDAGYSTYRIRDKDKNKDFSESTLQCFRENKMPSWKTLEKLCKILDCQPGDILEYVPSPEASESL